MPIAPSRIQVGDIVEAKLSFVVVSLREKNFKMMCVLRELTILDGSYTHVRNVCYSATENYSH
jgi:hypothetical protein